MKLSAAQFRYLEERVRASFGTTELAEGALELLPAFVRLTEHLVHSEADLARLGEVIQPILMSLPAFAAGPAGSRWLYDLAPLALAAKRSDNLTDLLRRFMPGRENELLSGLLAPVQGGGQPFGVQAEYMRAELPASSPEQAKNILSRLGVGALPQDVTQPFTVLIAGANVWSSYQPAVGRLVLEVHDSTSPYTITARAFEQACAVNQVLLTYALSQQDS